MLFLQGAEFYLKDKKLTTDFNNDPIGTLGNETVSQTLYIATRKIDGYTLLDGPGSNDNRGFDIDLANYSTVSKALKKCKKILPVILINYHSLLTGKGAAFLSTLEFYSRMFCHTDAALRRIKVLFNHVPDDTSREDIEELLEQFLDSDVEGNTPEVQNFLEIIVESFDIFIPRKAKIKQFLRKFRNATPITNASDVCTLALSEKILTQFQIQLQSLQLEITELLSRNEYNSTRSRIYLLNQFQKNIEQSITKETFNNCCKLVLIHFINHQKDVLDRFYESLENIFSPTNENNLVSLKILYKHLIEYQTYLFDIIIDNDNSILHPNDFESNIWNSINGYAHEASELSFQQLQVHLEKLMKIINSISGMNPKNQKGQEIISTVNTIINQKFDYFLESIISITDNWNNNEFEDISQNLNELVNIFNEIKDAQIFVGDNIVNCDEKIKNQINLVKSKIMDIVSLFDNRPNPENIDEFKSKFNLLKEIKSCSGLQTLLNFDESPLSIAQQKQVTLGNQLLESLKSGGANSNCLEPVKLICEIDLGIKYELNSQIGFVLNSVFKSVEKYVEKLDEELEKPKINVNNIIKYLNHIKKYSWLDNYEYNYNRQKEIYNSAIESLGHRANSHLNIMKRCWRKSDYDSFVESYDELESLSQIESECPKITEILDKASETYLPKLKQYLQEIKKKCSKAIKSEKDIKMTFFDVENHFIKLNKIESICNAIGLSDDFISIKNQLVNYSIMLSEYYKSIISSKLYSFNEFYIPLEALRKASNLRNIENDDYSNVIGLVNHQISDLEENIAKYVKSNIVDAEKELEKLKTARILSSHIPNILDCIKTNTTLILKATDTNLDDIQKHLISKNYVYLSNSMEKLGIGSPSYKEAIIRIIQYFQNEVIREKETISFFKPISNENFNSDECKEIIQTINCLERGILAISAMTSDYEQSKASINNIKSIIESTKQQVDQKIAIACDEMFSNLNLSFGKANRVFSDLQNYSSFPLPKTKSLSQKYEKEIGNLKKNTNNLDLNTAAIWYKNLYEEKIDEPWQNSLYNRIQNIISDKINELTNDNHNFDAKMNNLENLRSEISTILPTPIRDKLIEKISYSKNSINSSKQKMEEDYNE